MKIGITLRQCDAKGYNEKRDAIARDWYVFLDRFLPDLEWLLLPNLSSERIKAYSETWGLQGFILTGGDDLGIDAQRDNAETAVIEYALQHDLPVLGICRGFQMLQQYLGGKLHDCENDRHLAKTHGISFTGLADEMGFANIGFKVNSYHRRGILIKELMAPLEVIANTGEWTECALAVEPKLMGIMWHPERGHGNPFWVGQVLRHFFMLRDE